jgi:hypothetical protein
MRPALVQPAARRRSERSDGYLQEAAAYDRFLRRARRARSLRGHQGVGTRWTQGGSTSNPPGVLTGRPPGYPPCARRIAGYGRGPIDCGFLNRVTVAVASVPVSVSPPPPLLVQGSR